MSKSRTQSNTDVESGSASCEEIQQQSSNSDISTVQEEADREVEALLSSKDQPCIDDSADNASDHLTDSFKAEESPRPWYKQRIVAVCMAGVGLITFLQNYLDELTPIYASAQPQAGGLGMPAHEFAWPLVFGGVVLMVFSLFFYPRAQKRWGYLTCCKTGLLLTVPSLLLLPFAHTFVQTQWATQACLCLGIGLIIIAKLMALASAAIIVNVVAPMDQIGSVNGAAQTLQGLARSAGPFLAGVIWGSCSESGLPGKQYLPFAGTTTGFIAAAVLYINIDLPN